MTRGKEQEETPAADLATVEIGAGDGDSTGGSSVRSVGPLSQSGSTGVGGSFGSLASVSGEGWFGPSPLETLRTGEIDRTRFFLRVAIVMAFVVAGAAGLLHGDRIPELVVFSGMVAIVVGCGWMLWKLRSDEGAYTPSRALAVGYCTVYGAFTGIYFFGPFSPAPVIIPFGLFFFSLSRSFRGTLSVYLTCAVVMLAMFIGDMTGTFATRGLIRGADLSLLDQLMIIGLVETVFLGTFLIGRASRTAQLRAIEAHGLVVRNLAQREALLHEARQDLDRALRAGGMGRHTDQVLGSFRLGKVLGRGAMGEVYEAVHMTTGEPAAVKLLQVDMLRNIRSLRRFTREARIAASLKEHHIVQVLEVGGLDAPVPYIAMERLEGQDLSEHLRQHARLALADAVRMVRHVSRGLEAAREAGIVHRDLKPANLFHARLPDGRHLWKILDFGVSKLADSTYGTLTRDDAIVGTPEYMAPEQSLGLEVSHRTDIYALGVICYRALTGTPPFTGEGVVQVLFKVVREMPARPSDLVASLSTQVDAVLAIAMAKAPEDRFDTATELALAFEAAAEGRLGDEVTERAARLDRTNPWA